jgi:hypothetical protein
MTYRLRPGLPTRSAPALDVRTLIAAGALGWSIFAWWQEQRARDAEAFARFLRGQAEDVVQLSDAGR